MALALMVGVSTPAAAQANHCVNANMHDHYVTVENNCGQNVYVWLTTDNDVQPGEGLGMSLNAGQSDTTDVGPTATRYRFWACTNLEAPTDTNTRSKPTYNSTSVQCSR